MLYFKKKFCWQDESTCEIRIQQCLFVLYCHLLSTEIDVKMPMGMWLQIFLLSLQDTGGGKSQHLHFTSRRWCFAGLSSPRAPVVFRGACRGSQKAALIRCHVALEAVTCQGPSHHLSVTSGLLSVCRWIAAAHLHDGYSVPPPTAEGFSHQDNPRLLKRQQNTKTVYGL